MRFSILTSLESNTKFGMKTDKKPLYYKTSFFPTLYAGIMFLAMTVQFILKKFNFDFINANLEIPMEMLSYCWVAISAAYVGVDRASYAIKTSQLEAGAMDCGDPATNRRVILLSGLLLATGFIFNIFVDADFQLPSLTTSFGSSITLYCAGQKAVKCTKYISPKSEGSGE